MDEQRRQQRAEELAALVAERHGQMVGYAGRQLRHAGVPLSSADPEDVVHNALTNVLACPEPVERLRPYVYTAIKNEVRHVARRYRCGQGYASLDADVQLETAAGEADPCGAADRRLDLEAALTALPPQQRRSVWCNKALGFTQAETARVMGAAPGTVATHVSRAVVALRVALGTVPGVVVAAVTAAWVRTGTSPVDPGAGGDLVAGMESWVARWGVPQAVVTLMAGVALMWLAYASLYPRYLRRKTRLGGTQGEESSVNWHGEEWTVRHVSGMGAVDKTYRCPGCDQTIHSGVAHVVAWPRHGGTDDRRHWHHACWNARDRRRARAGR